MIGAGVLAASPARASPWTARSASLVCFEILRKKRDQSPSVCFFCKRATDRCICDRENRDRSRSRSRDHNDQRGNSSFHSALARPRSAMSWIGEALEGVREAFDFVSGANDVVVVRYPPLDIGLL